MALPLQRLQGKYEILERLQEGGMGAIYKVRHRLLGEVRVIKLIRPQLKGDETLEARFLREARAAAKLSHPNIAKVYDYSVDEEGVAYIVMEFIQGMTLNELMRCPGQTSDGLLPMALVLEIASQSLRAIGHVHRQDIVHRDVSSDNLMLTRDVDSQPLVKLIDLGLAKTVEGTSKLTAAGVFLGKFRYAAPEQFEDSFPGDRRRGDLYSFGVVLYELLTGKYPIVGKSPSSLIAGHLFRPPMSFEASDPDRRVPENVRQAVMRSLAKSPEERFATAESFAAALAGEKGSGKDWDLTSPDVQSVVESTQKIVRPIIPAPRPGSTQSRLDRNFAAEPTPLPSPQELEAPSPAAAGSEEETVVLAAAPRSVESVAASTPLDEEERTVTAPQVTVSEISTPEDPGPGVSVPAVPADQRLAVRPPGDAGELLRQARELHREGRLEVALAVAKRAREQAPDHAMIEILLFELEREIDARESRHAREVSRRSAEAEIRELVERGDVAAAAERLPEALEVAGPTLVLQNLRAQIDRDLEIREPDEQAPSRGVEELVATARERARGEAFAAAAELLRQALNQSPGHPEALALRASVETCLEAQAEELEAEEEVERTLTSIRTLLADGDVAEALAGVGRAVHRFGQRDDLRTLESEITRAQTVIMDRSVMDNAVMDSAVMDRSVADSAVSSAETGTETDRTAATVILEQGIATAFSGLDETAVAAVDDSEATGDVAEVTSSIHQMRSRGEHGRALETLQHAVEAHGNLEVFKELRYELSQEMLERASDDEDSASRYFTEAAPQPPAVEPPAFDKAPAGLDDLPLGPGPSTADIAFDAAPQSGRPPVGPPRRQGSGGGGWKLLVGLLLVVAIGLLIGMLLGQHRTADSPEAESETTVDEPAQAAIPGFVLLDARPWAEVMRITALQAGQGTDESLSAEDEIPITPSRYTPVVLELPPGRYRLDLSYPPGGQTQDLEIEVTSEVTVEHQVSFVALDGKQYFSEVDW